MLIEDSEGNPVKDQVVFQADIMHALAYRLIAEGYIPVVIGLAWRDMSSKFEGRNESGRVGHDKLK